MSRICPTCNYQRTATETCPEWQCPSCEKAYNKAAGGDIAASHGAYTYIPVPKVRFVNRSLFSKLLIILAFAAWAGVSYWPTPDRSKLQVNVSEQPQVTLYATAWCGYCASARQFFAANGIRYTEHDIEKSAESLAEHKRLGGNGVPLIVIGDSVVKGYNEDGLRSLLKPWLKP